MDIIYFSKTGNCNRIAHTLAQRMGVTPIEITSPVSWKGAIGYWRAAFYAMRGKEVPFALSADLPPESPVVVVAPIWAGKIAPPAATFLKTLDPSRVTLITVASASDFRAPAQYARALHITKSRNNEDDVVQAICN